MRGHTPRQAGPIIMSISFSVLGNAGEDNALIVTVDTGQAVSRVLFDCGEGCLRDQRFSDILAIDHLCFSHLHMDHVSGFDSFFRCVYDRGAKDNHIWGPPGMAAIAHHRFRGFLWNLVDGRSASWRLHDLHDERVETSRLELAEAFAPLHSNGERPYDRVFLTGSGYTVEAHLMDHATPSAAYILRETPRVNIDMAALSRLGLRPGPWLQRLRGPAAQAGETIDTGDGPRSLADLQDRLLTRTPGDSIAYLTDFLLDEKAMDRLSPALQGVGTIICESQYRSADQDLARRYHHMTAAQAAAMAKRADAGRLVLFHISDRYSGDEWRELLGEAQTVFDCAAFPDHWDLDAR
jgi:ribonuclease Z